MVTIKQVTTQKELKQFVQFGMDIFKGNPYYCPPLVFDEINTFDKSKNPALEVSEFVNYLAYRDDKIVGRICGIINHEANKAWNRQKVRFGWFDFIDDMEVSSALLDAVRDWGRSKGMRELNGPVGFTDLDHQGLLIEGFEHSAPMASLYNYPYYAAHLVNYGLQKEADWIEFQIQSPRQVPDKMQRVANIVKDKYQLNVVKVKNSRELRKRFGYEYFDVIDKAYQPLYNYQPLTKKQKEYYCNMYFPLLNFDFVTIVTNEKEEIVAVGVGMPDISDALRKAKGKLFPFGWYHIIKALKAKKIRTFDLLLIAVRPDYQNKGVNSLIVCDQLPYFVKYGIEKVETTAILEVNMKSQANFTDFEKIQHKRRRAYIMQI
ncbi:MAG: N-acetyltransferase [Paludibacteraceae bacterium]|nr:N-acetyltransferase [Paludibacteraceae bacterium]